MSESLIAIALGVAIGLLSGVFGIGGSSIATPALRVSLDTPPLIALGSPLPVSIPVALSGMAGYRRSGLVSRRAVSWTVLGGLPTVILGSLLTKWVPSRALMLLVALAMLWAAWELMRSPSGEAEGRIGPRWPAQPAWALVAVAAAAGLLSGMLANGGGFLLVPAFVLLFGASVRQAAATSLPCVAVLAVPGTVVHALLGHVDGWLALRLTIGVIPATYVGALLSLRMAHVHLRRPFGIFIGAFAVYFFVREAIPLF